MVAWACDEDGAAATAAAAEPRKPRQRGRVATSPTSCATTTQNSEDSDAGDCRSSSGSAPSPGQARPSAELDDELQGLREYGSKWSRRKVTSRSGSRWCKPAVEDRNEAYSSAEEVRPISGEETRKLRRELVRKKPSRSEWSDDDTLHMDSSFSTRSTRSPSGSGRLARMRAHESASSGVTDTTPAGTRVMHPTRGPGRISGNNADGLVVSFDSGAVLSYRPGSYGKLVCSDRSGGQLFPTQSLLEEHSEDEEDYLEMHQLREEMSEFFRTARIRKELLRPAQAWCAQVGAVTMSEVMEFSSDLERALGLKILEQRRFRAVVAARKNEYDWGPQEQDAEPTEQREEELLPGLALLMRDALLEDRVPETEAWIEEMGVASVEELIEVADELEDHLELKVMDRQRLRKVMSAWQASAVGTAGWSGTCNAHAAPNEEMDLEGLPGHLGEIFGEAELLHHIPTASKWCDDVGVRTLGELANVSDKLSRELSLSVLEKRRLEKAFVAHVGSHEVAVATVGCSLPGVTEILVTARLSDHVNAAQEWCVRQGAATIEEIGGALKELAEDLGLKTMEQRRLQKAYDDFVCAGSPRAAEGPEASQAPAPAPAQLTLRELLADARMSQRLVPAEAWCVEMGVSLVEDLQLLRDDFVADLELRPMELTRFEASLSRFASSEIISEPLQPIAALVPPAQERRRRGQTTLASPAAVMSPRAKAASTPMPASKTGTGEWPGDQEGQVLGLAELLERARLTPYLAAMQAWCATEGAVLLEEVAESSENVKDDLGFRLAEKLRFDQALACVPELGPAARAEFVQRHEQAQLEQLQKLEAERRDAEEKNAEKEEVERKIQASQKEAEMLRAELDAFRNASEDTLEQIKAAQLMEQEKAEKSHRAELAITKFQMTVRQIIAIKKQEAAAKAKPKGKAKGKAKGKRK